MRVRWVGGARTIAGIGMPVDGAVYDWPDQLAASLVEQGKAVVVREQPQAVLGMGTVQAKAGKE